MSCLIEGGGERGGGGAAAARPPPAWLKLPTQGDANGQKATGTWFTPFCRGRTHTQTPLQSQQMKDLLPHQSDHT